MILTTTPTVEGSRIVSYLGVVTGETIIGANVLKDFMAGLRDFFGGRSGTYEQVLRDAKDTSLQEMEERARELGANAIVGIDLDYETVGQNGSMLMVTCSGTASVVKHLNAASSEYIESECRIFAAFSGFSTFSSKQSTYT